MAGTAPEWTALLKLARSKNPAERCHSVTQAQSALERLLSAHDYRREGEPFHASVTLAANEFGLELPDDLRDIIRLRNQIAHEGHIPGMLEAEDAVEVFQTAFQRLAGALEGPRRRAEAGQRTSSRSVTRQDPQKTRRVASDEPRSRGGDRPGREENAEPDVGEARGSAARRRFVAVEGPARPDAAWSSWTDDDDLDEESEDSSDLEDPRGDFPEEDEDSAAIDVSSPGRPAASRARSATPSERASGSAPDRSGPPRSVPDHATEPAPARRASPSRQAPERTSEPGAGNRAAPPRTIVVPPEPDRDEGRPSTGWARVKEGGRDVSSGEEESPGGSTRSRRKATGRPKAAGREGTHDRDAASSSRPGSDTPSAILYFGYAALTWIVAVTALFAYQLYGWAAPQDTTARAGWIVLGLLAGAVVAVISGILAWPVVALAGLIGVGCLTGGLLGGAVGAGIGALIGGHEGAQTGAEIGGLILGAVTSIGLVARHYLSILFLRFKEPSAGP